MNEKITAFINDLQKYMDGMPRNEIEAAIRYYEEYLYDALEEGKDPEEEIARLGPAKNVAAAMRTETSLHRARRDPGLRNYNNGLRNAFRIAATPFAVMLLAVLVLLTYSLVLSFFAVSITLFASGIAVALGLSYQAFQAAPRDFIQIMGALGLGLFAGGILLLLSWLFYKLAKRMIAASASLVRLIIRKPGGKAAETAAGATMETITGPTAETLTETIAGATVKANRPERNSGKNGENEDDSDKKRDGDNGRKQIGGTLKSEHPKRIRPAALYLGLLLAGFVLFCASGLPLKYFRLFNSMEPQTVTTKTEEYDCSQVNRISITTIHSNITIVPGSGDTIAVSSKKADWLEQEIRLDGDTLTFSETSNGRLPLLEVAQLHENVAGLTISLPEGCGLDEIILETYGGTVHIENLTENIRAKTASGRMVIDCSKVGQAVNVTAQTGTGRIDVESMEKPSTKGTGAEQEAPRDSNRKPRQGTPQTSSFELDNGADKTIEATSDWGSIRIKIPA